MNTAIYARKSTDQAGVADDQKSVARQIEHARAFAATHGWTIDEGAIFVDDGVSGAEFSTRPGFVRLLNALRPRRTSFEILIVSELSRLGREQLETGYALKQLSQAGVRVWSYLEGREVLLDTPTDKFLMSAVSFAAELEREKARQRTYDAMLRKAKAGHVTGGRVFGYDNVRSDNGGVVRVINEAEAAIVREIFDRYARGQGLRAIGKILNAAGAPSPRAQQGRPSGWCPSSISEALHRPLYRGEIVWNQSRKRNSWGIQDQHSRPEAEWIRVDAPQLRIVSVEAWAAAHDRLGAARETYLRTNRGTLWGKPANGIESKYLLTGLGQCAICGGGLYVATRQHGRARAHFYACATFHRKGHTICPNNQQIAMEDADWAVMEAVQDELLDPAVVAYAMRESVEVLTGAPNGLADRLEALTERVRELSQQIDRLTGAIAAGGELAGLMTALKQRESDRRRVAAEIQQLEALTRADARDPSAVQDELSARVQEWRTLAGRNVAQGRQVIRKLLRGRVRATPQDDGMCELSGWADYGKLFAGILLATALASPAGFEPAFWP